VYDSNGSRLKERYADSFLGER